MGLSASIFVIKTPVVSSGNSRSSMSSLVSSLTVIFKDSISSVDVLCLFSFLANSKKAITEKEKMLLLRYG